MADTSGRAAGIDEARHQHRSTADAQAAQAG